MIPFPTSRLPTTDNPKTFHRREITVNSEFSPWSHLGEAIRNVFDLSLLWDVICSWFRSLRDSVPAWPPAPGDGTPNTPTGGPGHGSSQVAINFWFFLTIYYGFYNLVGLLWITKIFNMYSLNWWPPQLGFPVCTPRLLGWTER